MIFTRFGRPLDNDAMVLKSFCVRACVRVCGLVSSFTRTCTVYSRTVLNGTVWCTTSTRQKRKKDYCIRISSVRNIHTKVQKVLLILKVLGMAGGPR
jgi:hypothetical protein